MRIDSSGRLLVGTSTSVDANSLIQSINAGESSIALGRNDATVSAGNVFGGLTFYGNSDGVYDDIGYVRCVADGTHTTSGTISKPTRLEFSTTADGQGSPAERMRITNGGSVLIGNDTASNNGKLYVNQNTEVNTAKFWDTNASTVSDGVLAVVANRNTTNNTFYAISYYNAGTSAYRFRVADSGNCTNTNNSYGAISDIKLKENIVDATSQWSDIKALQVRKYNFKEGQTHTQIGLIAQEVELVSPGLVSESPDRNADGNDLGTVTKSVNYSVLYMKAVKALQEAMERIEQLEASNADLLARVSALESA